MKILKSYEIFESFEILWKLRILIFFWKFWTLKFYMKSLKLLTEYTSHKVYSLWGRVGKMPIRKKQNSLLFDKWYFDPPTHGISTPLPMEYRPLYPWYFDPPTHGISTPLPMEYRTPTHECLTSLPISWLEMGVKKNMGVQFIIQGGQFSIRGFNIPWMKIDPRVNLPWGSKYHMTPGHNIFVFRDRLLYRWPH